MMMFSTFRIPSASTPISQMPNGTATMM